MGETLTDEMRDAMRENTERDLAESHEHEKRESFSRRLNDSMKSDRFRELVDLEDGCPIGVGGLMVRCGINPHTGQPLERRSAMVTTMGREVDIFAVKPENISLADAIHQLPNICRFNGAVNVFYSVAQHSILVASLLVEHNPMTVRDAQNAQWGLLHDVHEVIFGDIVAPIREAVGLDALETAAQRAVAEKFTLPWPPPPDLALADNMARAIEWRELRPSIPLPATLRGYLNPNESTRTLLLRLDKACPWHMPANFFEFNRYEARSLFKHVANELALSD